MFLELFKIDPRPIEFFEGFQKDDEMVPVSTSVRILSLDYNFIGIETMNNLAKVLATQKQVKILSLKNCRITGNELLMFSQKGI